jgi:hypothetical protein
MVVAHHNRRIYSLEGLLPCASSDPITYRGFDGIAWNTPIFMSLNYLLLAAIYVWLLRTHKRDPS